MRNGLGGGMRSAASMVKQARLLAGYSRAELARAANVAPSTIGRIETGALDPTWSLLTSVLAAAGYRLGDTLSSLGDPAAVDAAVQALSSSPAIADGNEWNRRWQRIGLLTDTGRARDQYRLAAAAGVASSLRARPGVRVFRLDRDLTRLVEDLQRAGQNPAVSGPPVFGDMDPDAVAVYVLNPDTLDLPVPESYRPVLIALPTPAGMPREAAVDGLPTVSRERALVDSFASGGRVADRAEAYVSRLGDSYV